MGLRHAFALTFRAGGRPLFFHWRRAAPDQTITGASEPGCARAPFFYARGRPARAAVGGLADFFLANVGSGQRWSSGGRASDDDGGAGASYGVVDHSPTASAAG